MQPGHHHPRSFRRWRRNQNPRSFEQCNYGNQCSFEQPAEGAYGISLNTRDDTTYTGHFADRPSRELHYGAPHRCQYNMNGSHSDFHDVPKRGAHQRGTRGRYRRGSAQSNGGNLHEETHRGSRGGYQATPYAASQVTLRGAPRGGPRGDLQVAPQAANQVALRGAPRGAHQVAKHAANQVALRGAPRGGLRGAHQVAPQAANQVTLRGGARGEMRGRSRDGYQEESHVEYPEANVMNYISTNLTSRRGSRGRNRETATDPPRVAYRGASRGGYRGAPRAGNRGASRAGYSGAQVESLGGSRSGSAHDTYEVGSSTPSRFDVAPSVDGILAMMMNTDDCRGLQTALHSNHPDRRNILSEVLKEICISIWPYNESTVEFAVEDQYRYCEMLLYAGASPDIILGHKCEPLLIYLLKRYRIDLAKLVLRFYPDVNAGVVEGSEYFTSIEAVLNYRDIHQATKSDVIDIVKHLIYAGARNLVQNSNGKTWLHTAIGSDFTCPEFIDLLSSYCDIDAKDRCGNTAILRAVERKDEKVVQKLIALGADVNARKSRQGWNPILASAYFKFLDIFNMLVAAGADMHDVDHEGNGVMHQACHDHANIQAEGLRDAIRLFIDYGLSINSINYQSFTPLLKALYEARGPGGSDITIRVLVQENADLSAFVPCDNTDSFLKFNHCIALDFAMINGHIFVILLFATVAARENNSLFWCNVL